jgi:hypothetical protein
MSIVSEVKTCVDRVRRSLSGLSSSSHIDAIVRIMGEQTTQVVAALTKLAADVQTLHDRVGALEARFEGEDDN